MPSFVNKTARKRMPITVKKKNVSKKSGYPLYCAKPTIFSSLFIRGIGKYERITRKTAINNPTITLNIPKTDRDMPILQLYSTKTILGG